MNRVIIALALVLLLFPTSETAGQTPGTSNFLEQAGAFQSKLTQWQQTLDSVNFNQLPSGLAQAQRNLLERERSACLTWIGILNREIAAMQSKSTLAVEVELILNARRFAGAASALDDSLNALTGDVSAVHRWLVLERKIGLMGTYLNEGRPIRQLNAIGVNAWPTTAKPQRPGRISGHIYRADTGKPLAGVKVMLGLASSFGPLLHSTETAADGGYIFSDVPPGQYRVGAYLKGFTRGNYGPHLPPQSWATINLVSGQKLSGVNMQLHPFASVTQMDEDAIYKAYPWQEFRIRRSHGRLSPDRKSFAIVGAVADSQQVWLYDLGTRHLVPATPTPRPGSETEASIIGWIGDVLYAKSATGNGNGPTHFFAATMQGTEEVPHIPPGLRHAPPVLAGCGREVEVCARNRRFIVSAVHPTCYHCTGLDLTVRPAVGGKPYSIAVESWAAGSFVLDSQHSRVLFPSSRDTIAVYNLDTRQVQHAYLPQAERLLDARTEPGGYLVAYTSYGPCQGYGDKGGLYPIHPVQAPYNACFANISYRTKK